MFLRASFSPSPVDISRDTIRDKASPKKRGSVAPLSLTRQGKPGFAERWRERRASETSGVARGGLGGQLPPPFFKNNVIKTFVIDVR